MHRLTPSPSPTPCPRTHARTRTHTQKIARLVSSDAVHLHLLAEREQLVRGDAKGFQPLSALYSV